MKFSDGTLAKYLHLEKASVKEGQTVKVGDTVGYVGNTGRSTAPHLHYQLNKGSRVLDPVSIMERIVVKFKMVMWCLSCLILDPSSMRWMLKSLQNADYCS